ncbi:MAG TPA: C45 family peptidase [Bacteroidales bacterium]|nr:C45 family peptidase [Bacteroidales bacterium]
MSAKKKTFFRRTGVRVLLGFLVLIVVLVIYFTIVAVDRPPHIADKSSLSIQRQHPDSTTWVYGNNWMHKSKSGLWEVYLEGKPFERGAAFGQLTKELLYYQETTFFDQIRELVPSDRYLKVLKYFTAFFNRNLDKSIPEEYKDEIYGTSFACAPEYDFIGSGYQRQLNYHAAHDIGHALQGLNLVGCTSFSVWDAKASDSCLLVGRNFDFYMGDKFAENKIVCFVNPSEGNRFMMITWADLIGVVSGMNEKGLTITLNASRSSVPKQAATPVTLLAREILQYASTIDEAYTIAKRRKLFVSESLMIGSAKDHSTAIIEKSPLKTSLFRSTGNQIICSNHFQSDAFANDEDNIENIKGSDSYMRYQRVEELLKRHEKMNESDVAAVLRDQRVMGDRNAGMGNQLSINQLIAHHSVIFKPDSLLVWVSTSPWQLGQYVAYDLHEVFGSKKSPVSACHEIALENRVIPADTFLNSPDYMKFIDFRKMSAELRTYGKNKEPLPEGFIDEYETKNPEFYQEYVNLSSYFEKTGDYADALKYTETALRKILPGLDEKIKLTERSQKLRKKVHNGQTQH